MINYGTKKDGDPTGAGAVTDNEFNSFLSELKAVIQPFMTLSEQETDQLIRSIDIATKAIYYQDVGTVNALHLERPLLGAKVETLQDGMTFLFKPKNTNTGPSTLKVENLEVKNIKFKGNDLSAGDLQFSVLYIAIYNSADNAFDIDVVGAGIGINKLEKMLVLENNEVQNLYGNAVNTLSKWAVGKIYEQGRVEFYNGLRYIATAPNTATVDNAPDKAGAPWVELELWQRDKMIPVGYIYLNKTDNTNPSALANPWPGNWATLSPDDYLAIQGGRYVLNTQYSDGLPNIIGAFDPDGWFSARSRIEGTGPFRKEQARTEYSSDHKVAPDGMRINFDASLSNPIYNNNQEINGNPDSHVQPQTLGVAGFVKTAFAF